MIKKIIEAITPPDDGPKKGDTVIDLDKIMSLDELVRPKEPDLRVMGLFSDVSEEKIAELIHAMLYLNEVNIINSKEDPIEFYLSTYGGSADDMFGMYDAMRMVRETTEIHTLGLGKVMSAGVLLLAAGTKGKRRVGKNCRVMIHGVAGGFGGNLPQWKTRLKKSNGFSNSI